MNLTFTGGKELAAALRKIPDAIAASNILSGAVLAGAGIIRDAAAARCPRPAVRRRPGTMRLADSIKATVTERARTFVTVNVGTKVRYAHLVEYGHQIIARGPNRQGLPRSRRKDTAAQANLRRSLRIGLQARQAAGSGGFVPAQPFLRPAFDENREAVLRKIGEVLGAGIEAEAKRAAGPSVESATILSAAA